MTRRRTWLVAAVVAGLVVAGTAVTAGTVAWKRAHRSDLERAVALLPADTLRVSWTDWAGVRAALGAGDLTGSRPTGLSAFMAKAFATDLSAASTLDESAVALADKFGFSPADAQWEAFGQARDGAAMLLRLPDDTDFDALATRLEDLGYRAPAAERTGGGVWSGGEDLVAQLDPTISPELQYVALLADQHLVVTSDTSGYLGTAVAAASGGHGLAVPEVADGLGDPLSATIFVDDFACEALAMSQADVDEQAQARQLIADAGGINPVTGLAVAAYADRRLRVAIGFESSDRAEHNATARVRLASGPAPGQGMDFSDLFAVDGAHRDGSTVVLDLTAKPDSYAFSNLISGPVLFESC